MIGGALRRIGRTAMSSSTMAGAMYGTGAGALWGAVSGDTSVLGGAMMGAGMGAVGGFYAGMSVAGMKSITRAVGMPYTGYVNSVRNIRQIATNIMGLSPAAAAAINPRTLNVWTGFAKGEAAKFRTIGRQSRGLIGNTVTRATARIQGLFT